jgi:hypothetical protein
VETSLGRHDHLRMDSVLGQAGEPRNQAGGRTALMGGAVSCMIRGDGGSLSRRGRGATPMKRSGCGSVGWIRCPAGTKPQWRRCSKHEVFRSTERARAWLPCAWSPVPSCRHGPAP